MAAPTQAKYTIFFPGTDHPRAPPSLTVCRAKHVNYLSRWTRHAEYFPHLKESDKRRPYGIKIDRSRMKYWCRRLQTRFPCRYRSLIPKYIAYQVFPEPKDRLSDRVDHIVTHSFFTAGGSLLDESTKKPLRALGTDNYGNLYLIWSRCD